MAAGEARAASWTHEHGAALIGTGFAAAERRVADAGLHVKAVRPPGVTTLEFRTDRVTLVLDEADVVTEVRAG